MSRTLLPIALALLSLVGMTAGCSRDEGKPAATRATVTPPPKPSPVARAGTPGAVEELYVDVEANPDEGSPPLTVHDATPPLTYKWDFGDGSPPGTDASPTHVYDKAGEYTATVTIKDSTGKSGSEEADVFVEAP